MKKQYITPLVEISEIMNTDIIAISLSDTPADGSSMLAPEEMDFDATSSDLDNSLSIDNNTIE